MIDPIAFHLGPLTVRWYGVCVAAGFMCGYALAQTRASRVGLPPEAPGDLAFGAMVGGIVGARLLYVVHNWRDEFSGHLVDVLKIYQGGLVFYGGFLGAVCVLVVLSRRRRWSPYAVGDLFAPCLPLGHALGRIGCLVNGCCFGRPYDGPLSVIYPGAVEGLVNGPLFVQRQLGVVSPEGIVCAPVFPIQAVAAVTNLSIAVILLCLGRKERWRGRLFALYLIIFGTARFAVEFGRGDYLRRPGGLTPAQWICFLLLVWGVAWLWRLRGKKVVFAPQTTDDGGKSAS